jgi:hypothetical protein
MPNSATAEHLHAVFHADLSDAPSGEEHWLSVNGRRIPLVGHTATTLARAHAQAPHLAAQRPGAAITHHTADPIALPTHSVIRVHVKHSLKTFKGAKGEAGVGHSALYLPPPSHLRTALAAEGSPHHVGPIDYVSTARAFLFHHPDLITNDPELADIIVHKYMQDDKTIAQAINNLAMLMRQMGPSTETGGWATWTPFTPDNGTPEYNGSKTYYRQDPTQQVQTKALEPLAPLLVRVKNDPALKDKKWRVQDGTSVLQQHGPTQLARAARRARPRLAAAAASGEYWTAAVANTDSIHGFKTSLDVVDASKKQIKLSLKNLDIRYLAAYIRFYDNNGQVISVPGWQPDDIGLAYDAWTGTDIQYDDLRFLGMLGPVDSVLGIPIYSDPGEVDVRVSFPPGAVSASIYGSGLGTGANNWPKTTQAGGTMTGIFNLGVPSLMLGFAVAAQRYKPLYDILKDLSGNKVFVATAIVLGAGYLGGKSGAQQKMDWGALSGMSQFLFTKGATAALNWVETTMASAEAAEQIPFAGWCMIAVNIATGLAQMAETIVAAGTSPWNIENTISTTITTTVTLHPDPRHRVFPAGGATAKRSYTVKLFYQDQTRPTDSQSHDVPADSSAITLPAAFPDNTLGGQVKFEVDFYIDSWLAGKATTGWIANDEEHAADIEVYLVEYPVPLTDKSIYAHARILTYNNGEYGWSVTATPPTATSASRDTAPAGNALGDWIGLSLSQRFAMLGLSWQAAGLGVADCDTGSGGQLSAFMNINIPGEPLDSVKFPSCGFVGLSRLVYDPYPPKFMMKDGNWVLDPTTQLPTPDPADQALGDYYVDPRPANVPPESGGGYHLRKVTLDKSTPFDMGKVRSSWGRFAYFPDSVCLHPSGLVIAVNSQYHKLQIVTIEKEGKPDDQVPLGAIGCGPALDRARQGLMFRPIAVTCSYDGTILVLEDSKSSTGGPIVDVVSRLSAYDLHMNPVSRFFDDDGQPTPWLYLSNAPDYNYLDLASVGDQKLTYIYVLYYTGAGASPSDYHMSIYTYGLTKPLTNPLVTTDSIPAAKLAVDMWHSAYTLNFAMVTDGKGNPAGPANPTTGPAGRTVPSVSMWLPPVPTS